MEGRKDANGTGIGYHIPTGTIKYDRAVIDTEKKMNLTSGIYSAPKDGTYMFGIDGHKCSGNALADVSAYHNGKLVKTVSHSDAAPQSVQLTSFWTLELKTGDTVYLVNNQISSLYTNGDAYQFAFIGLYIS